MATVTATRRAPALPRRDDVVPVVLMRCDRVALVRRCAPHGGPIGALGARLSACRPHEASDFRRAGCGLRAICDGRALLCDDHGLGRRKPCCDHGRPLVVGINGGAREGDAQDDVGAH
eukprot:6209120-Prymnesium_polylepis.2